ncbi:Hsp20/alpha crystallin family protein [bacterium]|nr:MAG: Hsp20/alpha crystallin family protein [bacterium]
MTSIRKSWEPRIDVTEEATRLVVRAEIPGVRPRDVDVSFSEERHTLVVHGYRPERDEDVRERTGVYQLEILYGEFEREVRLPDLAVDPAGIKATFRDGMLTITLPKRERIATRQILTIVSD